MRSLRRLLPAIAALITILLPPSAALPAAGEPDRGFGLEGSVVTDLQGLSNDRCLELLVQPDRKLVCVGQSTREGSEQADVAIVRYLPTGQLDQTFGSHGITLFDSGLGLGDVPGSAVLDRNGRIVIAGVVDVAGRDRQDFLVARFDADGSLDPSFGSRGFVTTDVGSGSPDVDWGYGIALQRDGKIVVAGQTDRLAVLLRYTPTGALDPSFGTAGRVQADLVRGTDDAAHAIAIQRDGRILVGSYSNRAPAFVMARFRADGRADRSFGTGGVARARIGISVGEVRALMVQPDGKVVAAGWALGSESYYTALARFWANGRVDQSFGRGGSVVSKLMDGFTEVGGYAAGLQADGKIVVAGGNGGRFLVARYLKTGKPDVGFGGIGFVTIEPGLRKHSYASAMFVQSDGRIVAAGAAKNSVSEDEDFALVRLSSRRAAATRIAWFSVRTTPRGVVVHWRTVAESRSRRFLLYRQQWGRDVLVGRFASRGGPSRGATYSLTDRGKLESMCCPGYWLVEEKRDGVQVRYGPLAR